MKEQHVEVVTTPVAQAGALWQPVVGTELTGLLDRKGLDDESTEQVREQAVDILARGVTADGKGPARRTGLVVGYVQSGKTMSFTSVIAAAHDNGCPLVVLLTGTKTNLHDQTSERLAADLDIKRSGDKPWIPFANPRDDLATVASMSAHLRQWRRPVGLTTGNPFFEVVRQQPRTVLVTVMKNSTRLDHLSAVLVRLRAQGVDLAELPVLVVDDEADQAGLNARAASDVEEPTATYRAIRDLRDELPRHTYLEYTATPQAPLLLNLLDTLSPDYAVVLEPGAGYTGGSYFFGERRDDFVRRIDQQEADAAAADEPEEPPETLKQALASFLVAALLAGVRGQEHSSMLVHPSHTRDLHVRYASWVANILETWREVLPAGGDLRDDVLSGYVRPAFDDLAPEQGEALFAQLVEALPVVVGALQQRVVNSGTAADSTIDWDHHRFWVLVGGNKLDRGYTVEGLVTTYMPRGTGGGQADTVQQRARFFGYKRAYADLCRAWLTPAAVDLYVRYVEHEEALRAALVEMQVSGDSLKQWRRKMLLDSRLKPCRAGVIGLPYIRARVKGDTWTQLARVVDPTGTFVTDNQRLVRDLVASRGAGRVADNRDPRPDHPTTRFRIPLAMLITELLEPWRRDDIDTSYLNGLLLLLGARLDERPELAAEVYLMRDLLPRQRSHDRVSVTNLFEGYRPDSREGDFPGDRVFRADEDDVVSVQVHWVDLLDPERRVQRDGVPALAVWLPRALASDVILGQQ